MQERMTEIEIKLAHMEQALSELSDVVYSQQTSLDRLKQTCNELRQRIAEGGDTPSAGAGDERPPHY